MRLEKLGTNVTVLHVRGMQVLFSYDTPVAVRTPNGFIKSEIVYSRTTARHIATWMRTFGNNLRADSVPQDQINRILGGG